MEEEQLLKSGERINQLFSTDIKIIQNRESFQELHTEEQHYNTQYSDECNLNLWREKLTHITSLLIPFIL